MQSGGNQKHIEGPCRCRQLLAEFVHDQLHSLDNCVPLATKMILRRSYVNRTRETNHPSISPFSMSHYEKTLQEFPSAALASS
jgi:hypothetical protein